MVFIQKLWEQPVVCLAFASQPEAAASERGKPTQREATATYRCVLDPPPPPYPLHLENFVHIFSYPDAYLSNRLELGDIEADKV